MVRFGSMSFRCPRTISGAALAVSVLLLGGIGVGGATAAEVRIQSKVQSVAQLAAPDAITLEPGEVREVTIQIAANFPWRLSLASANPAITAEEAELEGRAGGFKRAGNTFKVLFRCAPEAHGPQSGSIEYSVVRR